MPKEIVLITGANGLVAKRLQIHLQKEYEVRFLTRKKVNKNDFIWDISKKKIDKNALIGVKHIVHLAGAGVADKRWTKKRKKEILESRVNSTILLLNALKENNIKVENFISASAIGYYGTKTSSDIFDENSPKGNDFLSDVCADWERSSYDFLESGVYQRRIILRLGVVLAKNGGALQKMIKPIKLNIGAVLGSGKQFMPWVHIDDLCGIIDFAIKGKLESTVYNVVAPEHITNKIITKQLAEVYNKKLFLPNIPSWVLKMLFGQSSVLLLEGTKVSSEKITKAGYSFQFPTLKSALLNLK